MRMYIQPSWTDAAEDHDLWSGGNGQYRGDPSINLSTFDAKGRARVEAFTDEALDKLKEKNKPKISIADKILPQRKRVQTLTTQMQELVADYQAGKMSIEEYSMLLSVVSAKRARAKQLLAKAVSVSAPFEQIESAPSKQPKPTKPSPTAPQPSSSAVDSVKNKASQLWTEAKVFLVGSVAACAGLMWLAN